MGGFKTDSISYNNMPWMQNAVPVFNPTFNATDSLGTFTPGIYGWGTSSGSSTGSSESSDSLDEFQRKEAESVKKKKTDSTKKKEEKEIASTGLALTEKQLDHTQSVSEKKNQDEHKGMTIAEEMGCYTAMGAVGAVGVSPITNSKTYLFGEHNKLFSKAKNIYGGRNKTYNEVYKANSKLMSEAKAAMRKAEKFKNKAEWKGRLSKGAYNEMTKEMKNVLQELARDPKNEAARTKLKNLTEAINKTTSQRVGWIKKGWRELKNNTIRKWTGKPLLNVTQPTKSTFTNTLSTITANSQATTQAASTASKGMSLLKGAGKLVKKAPWLVGAFEFFADKDLISAAYKKDASTGNKQLGKTAFKAAGAMAGMALGVKAGALIGSVVPGAGTIVGGIIGAVAGFAIGGALSWLGREGGKLAGDALFGEEEVGVKAKAENITKAGTQEQLTEAVETVTWAREHKDQLTKAESDSIRVLEEKLVAKGFLQPLTA